MDVRRVFWIALWVAIPTTSLGDQPPSWQAQWPQWRGPANTGVSSTASPPTTWSETENVRWKTAIPGKGHSTPVVWGNTIFLTAAVPYGEVRKPTYSGAPGAHDNAPITQQHRFVALAVNRDDGSIRWQKVLKEALPHEGAHYTGSLASGSPVTDGTHYFAYFGSYGLYCLTDAGEVVWKRDFGRMNTKHGHGEGSSPALYGNTIVVNWDHEGDSFIAALDKRTGKEIWKAKRDEVTSWSTPIIIERQGETPAVQVIVCGTNRVRSYDIRSGEVVWQCGGLSHNIVASPVANESMLFVGSSYEKRALFAIKLANARGDITDSESVAWTTNQRTPYVPSPLLYGKHLYFLRHYQGILTRLEAETGAEPLGPFRLGAIGNVYASPWRQPNACTSRTWMGHHGIESRRSSATVGNQQVRR